MTTWKNYEELTRYIYETLGKKSGVKIIGSGNSCKVKGKSGATHQIDVLTSHSDGIHDYKTAIECKHWNKKISKEAITKLSFSIIDANISKGIIVSSKGFTPDAQKVALQLNIGLVELKEQDLSNVERLEPALNVTAFSTRVIITNVKIDVLDTKIRQSSNEVDGDFYVHLANNKIIELNTFLEDFKNEIRDKNPIKPIQKTINFTVANLVNRKTKEEVLIKSITLTGQIEKEEMRFFKIIDHVFFIMKSIFEEKSFSISVNGNIRAI